ncbi:hypothetical protein [Aquimarina agarivorans]|uniref:hypothetical protein n=1 Tax=Aquimarina agarivorans TaxID=980584 RepID=UPI000248FC5C|nr:hypothetical protein [Aquimarina agarivorans]
MIQILQQIMQYINNLDWSYIITFMLLAHMINYTKVVDWLFKVTRLKIQTRYRVLLIGLVYAMFLLYLRGYSTDKIEPLLQSFVFAMVFHKLIIEKILQQILGQKQTRL